MKHFLDFNFNLIAIISTNRWTGQSLGCSQRIAQQHGVRVLHHQRPVRDRRLLADTGERERLHSLAFR